MYHFCCRFPLRMKWCRSCCFVVFVLGATDFEMFCFDDGWAPLLLVSDPFPGFYRCLFYPLCQVVAALGSLSFFATYHGFVTVATVEIV